MPFFSALRTLSSIYLLGQKLYSVDKVIMKMGQSLTSFSLPLISFQDTAISIAITLAAPPCCALVRMPWSQEMAKW